MYAGSHDKWSVLHAAELARSCWYFVSHRYPMQLKHTRAVVAPASSNTAHRCDLDKLKSSSWQSSRSVRLSFRVVKRFSKIRLSKFFLSFSFSIHRNRISFPILRCATVLTYRDRPISLRVSADTECDNNNLTPRVKQADGGGMLLMSALTDRENKMRPVF